MDLKKMNNLTNNILTIGQILVIPDEIIDDFDNTTSNLYVVQKGDNLFSIARKYGVSINDIRMINNLNSDLLSVGQTLIIP